MKPVRSRTLRSPSGHNLFSTLLSAESPGHSTPIRLHIRFHTPQSHSLLCTKYIHGDTIKVILVASVVYNLDLWEERILSGGLGGLGGPALDLDLIFDSSVELSFNYCL